MLQFTNSNLITKYHSSCMIQMVRILELFFNRNDYEIINGRHLSVDRNFTDGNKRVEIIKLINCKLKYPQSDRKCTGFTP